jgi:hypothetical protein
LRKPKSNKSTQHNAGATVKTDPHLDILHHRYMDEKCFNAALQRLAKDITPEVGAMFFQQLVERKAFGHAVKPVVDLCLFISLLRSDDVSRRSYDFRDTFVAHDVEFWNLHRAPIPNGGTNTPHKVIPLNVQAGERIASAGALQKDSYVNATDHPNPNLVHPETGRIHRHNTWTSVASNVSVSTKSSSESTSNDDNTSSSKPCSYDSVSEILGKSHLPQHVTGYNNGRQVIGSLRANERDAHTKVASALNSSLHDVGPAEKVARRRQQQRPHSAPRPLRLSLEVSNVSSPAKSRPSQTLGKWLIDQFEQTGAAVSDK